MRRALAILLLLLVPASSALADNLFEANYQLGVPLLETSDFAGDPSFLGLGLGWRHFLTPSLSVGLSIGWNMFHQATDELITLQNGHVSGNQNRTINAVPMLAGTHYYLRLGEHKDWMPYAGLNLGTYFVDRRFDIGIFADVHSRWHFGLAPEIGVLIPLPYSVYRSTITVGLRYNYAFASGGVEESWLGLQLGVGYMDHY